jgi:hypothetical protein
MAESRKALAITLPTLDLKMMNSLFINTSPFPVPIFPIPLFPHPPVPRP